MADEEEKIMIGYISGMVRVELSPPNGFNLLPKIEVDGIQADIKKESIEIHPTWKYLAVVEEGDRIVKLILGNISRERTVKAEPGKTTRLNFTLSPRA